MWLARRFSVILSIPVCRSLEIAHRCLFVRRIPFVDAYGDLRRVKIAERAKRFLNIAQLGPWRFLAKITLGPPSFWHIRLYLATISRARLIGDNHLTSRMLPRTGTELPSINNCLTPFYN